MSYQHVLAAIDLSPHSLAVLKTAQTIAQRNNATLDAVHVLEYAPVVYGGEFSTPIDGELERKLTIQAQQALAELGKKCHIGDANQHLLIGTVKTAVLELAEKLAADLIVVGTHGQHGIDLLLGSRANALLHKAPCDVLAVRAKMPH